MWNLRDSLLFGDPLCITLEGQRSPTWKSWFSLVSPWWEPAQKHVTGVKAMITFFQIPARLAIECYFNIGKDTMSPTIFGGQHPSLVGAKQTLVTWPRRGCLLEMLELGTQTCIHRHPLGGESCGTYRSALSVWPLPSPSDYWTAAPRIPQPMWYFKINNKCFLSMPHQYCLPKTLTLFCLMVVLTFAWL